MMLLSKDIILSLKQPQNSKVIDKAIGIHMDSRNSLRDARKKPGRTAGYLGQTSKVNLHVTQHYSYHHYLRKKSWNVP